MPRPFRRDLAGIVAIGSCSSAADPLVRFSTTAQTNSRAVSLRDLNKEKKGGKGLFPICVFTRRSTRSVSQGTEVTTVTEYVFYLHNAACSFINYKNKQSNIWKKTLLSLNM